MTKIDTKEIKDRMYTNTDKLRLRLKNLNGKEIDLDNAIDVGLYLCDAYDEAQEKFEEFETKLLAEKSKNIILESWVADKGLKLIDAEKRISELEKIVDEFCSREIKNFCGSTDGTDIRSCCPYCYSIAIQDKTIHHLSTCIVTRARAVREGK